MNDFENNNSVRNIKEMNPEHISDETYNTLFKNLDDPVDTNETSVKKEISSMKRRINVQHQNFKDREMIGGLFANENNANKAIEEMKKLGMKNECIRLHHFDIESEKEHLELIGMGFPTLEAKYFEREYNHHKTLLTIKAGNKLEEVMEIIMRNGGDIGSDAYKENETDHNLHSFNNFYDIGRD